MRWREDACLAPFFYRLPFLPLMLPICIHYGMWGERRRPHSLLFRVLPKEASSSSSTSPIFRRGEPSPGPPIEHRQSLTNTIPKFQDFSNLVARYITLRVSSEECLKEQLAQSMKSHLFFYTSHERANTAKMDPPRDRFSLQPLLFPVYGIYANGRHRQKIFRLHKMSHCQKT